MSGHSKWKQIKHKKGAADVKRGKIFSQLSKGITVAARTGQNLDIAIARAKTANMPADNIDRAIKKGTGELNDGTIIESPLYEAYGPGGAALLIGTLTDNKNRTLAEVKLALKDHGGRLADSGSVQYLFERKGSIDVALDPTKSRDDVELALIDAGADDIEHGDDRMTVLTPAAELATVRSKLEAAGFILLDAALAWIPNAPLMLAEEDQAKLLTLMEALDELDDVEVVETNANL